MDKSDNKEVQKRVRFSYFRAMLIIDESQIKTAIQTCRATIKADKSKKNIMLAEIESLNNLRKLENVNIDLADMFDYIKIGEVQSNKDVLGKSVEIDTTTFMPKDDKDGDIIFFQISNNRDTNIPSLKKVGVPRVPIKLDDDEYIGEFMGILYDKNSHVLMIQCNKYSLSIVQFEHLLSLLYTEYMNVAKGKSRDAYKIISLEPIIDNGILKKMNKNTYYKKFSIKASDTSLLAITNDSSKTIPSISEVLTGFKGVNIDLSISVNMHKKEYVPLDSQVISHLYENFEKLPEHLKPNIDVYFQEREGSRLEAVNWLLPKKESVITFTMKPRASLAYNTVYQSMLEEYKGENGAGGAKSEINKIIFGAKAK